MASSAVPLPPEALAELAPNGRVEAVLVTNRSGGIIHSKYYCGPLTEPAEAMAWQQALFEVTKDEWSDLVNETQRVAVDAAGRILLYSGVGEVLIFLAGTGECEELTLSEVMVALIGVLKLVCAKDKKGLITQSEIVAHYDQLCLMMGTLIHRGVIEFLDVTEIELLSRGAYEEQIKRMKRDKPLPEDFIVPRLRPELPGTARLKKGGKTK